MARSSGLEAGPGALATQTWQFCLRGLLMLGVVSVGGGLYEATVGLQEQNSALAASITNGGRLYDDWQWATGNRQALPHPAYPTKAYYANVPSVTWRCRECHGPDYKGEDGQFAKGNHATGIKGIRAMAGADPVQNLGELLDGGDDDLLAALEKAAQIGGVLRVPYGCAYLGELPDGVADLAVQDAPVGDHDDRVEDRRAGRPDTDQLVG